MDRALLRLNVLLEATAAWGRSTSFEGLLPELPRMKWVLDFERCLVLLEATAHGDARVFEVTSLRAQEIDPAGVEPRALALLRRALDEGQPFIGRSGDAYALALLLESGSTALGSVSFVSSQSAYDYKDLRVAQFIAQALAGIFDRLAAREDEHRESAVSRRKNEFIAMLGHELRNPLAPMVTAIELLKRRGLAQAAREIAVLERQTAHMKRLVDDVMDISRIERGQIALDRRRLDVAAVVHDAVEIASPAIDAKGHRVRIDAPAATCFVDGDAGRLTQIVTNLLTNAARYSEPGREIAISAVERDGGVQIAVQDQGVGIAADVLPGIFEAFTQGARALDRSGGGLGLGLSLARSLARLHGGTLTGASEGPGKGSRFVLTLPASVSPPAPADVALPEVMPPGSGRVLVVDDNRDAANMLAEGLRAYGYEVVTAYDAAQALDAIDGAPLAAALVDIGLPAMDGLDLARAIRRRPTSTRPRLIALTGYGQESDRQQSRSAGFDAHLVKPVDLATVHRLLMAAG